MSYATQGYQALVHLLDTFLRLSLLCQHPTVLERSDHHHVRKALFRAKTDGGFGTFLDSTHLAAVLMECRRNAQGITQAMGVCTLLRQGQRLLAPRQPLVRIAQVPQQNLQNLRRNRIAPISIRRLVHLSAPRPHCSGATRCVLSAATFLMMPCPPWLPF